MRVVVTPLVETRIKAKTPDGEPVVIVRDAVHSLLYR